MNLFQNCKQMNTAINSNKTHLGAAKCRWITERQGSCQGAVSAKAQVRGGYGVAWAAVAAVGMEGKHSRHIERTVAALMDWLLQSKQRG